MLEVANFFHCPFKVSKSCRLFCVDVLQVNGEEKTIGDNGQQLPTPTLKTRRTALLMSIQSVYGLDDIVANIVVYYHLPQPFRLDVVTYILAVKEIVKPGNC